MKILITGASGKIGKRIVEALKINNDLVLLTRHTDDFQEPLKTYNVDISDLKALTKIVNKEKPNIIIHLAAVIGGNCDTDPVLTQKVNVDTTKYLGQLAQKNGVEKFIFSSTAAVYNQIKLEATTEEENLQPKSTYGKSKLAAENELKKVSRLAKTQFIALRIFNVYGPEFTDSIIEKLLSSTKQSPATILGPDNYYRDYISIRDVIKAFSSVISTDFVTRFTILNIASGVATNNTSLLNILKEHGVHPQFLVNECDLNISWANTKKAKQEVGFIAKKLSNFLEN